MKKLICFSFLFLVTTFIFAQVATTDFIKFDSTAANTNFSMEFKTAIFNQAIVIRDGKEQPLMLICLPANFERSPVPGTYNIQNGDKKRVKKGSQEAKIDYKNQYQSIDNGGTLTITENEGIHWFKGENIPLIDSKTKEMHTISFYAGMFIKKNTSAIKVE